MRIEVLGQARIVTNGASRPFPTGRPGHLLELLVLHAGGVVAANDLASALWPGDDDLTRAGRLRVTVARLRHELAGEIHIETAGDGYRLHADDGSLDRHEFESRAASALHGQLDAAPEALRLWRGVPYEGFRPSPELEHERSRLVALRAQLEAVSPHLADPDRAASRQAVTRPLAATPPKVGTIERTELLDRLPAVGEVPIVTVTAPVGFGKSVLLAQWARRQAFRVAWCHLSSDSNDPPILWRSLAQAATMATGRELAADDEDPTWTSVRLLNCLHDLDQRLGLVLDDAHVLTDDGIRRDLDGFLGRLPEHVTVAIASRVGVPRRSERLRLGGSLVNIDADQLAFTRPETVAVLSAEGGNSPTDEVVDTVRTTLGGWPALTVAAVRVVTTEKAATMTEQRLLADLPGADALVDEILAGLPAETASFLCDSAILDRLEPDLGRVIGSSEAAARAHLHSLVSTHQLLVRRRSTVTHREPLAGLLRQRQRRTDPSRVGALHTDAAWDALEGGRPDLALDHLAHTADTDTDLARAVLRPGLRHVLAHADTDRLRNWASWYPAGPDDEAVDLAVLASGFLPASERPPWVSVVDGATPTASSAVGALDQLRTGYRTGALATVARLRQRSRLDAAGEGQLIEAFAATVEFESRTYAGHHLDDREAGRVAELVAPWPWLWLRVLGAHALQAYLAGRTWVAARLEVEATAREPDLHPSWRELAGGSWGVVSALQASDRGHHATAAAELTAVTTRADLHRWTPTRVVGQLGLALVGRRAGEEDAALRNEVEAVTRLADLPEPSAPATLLRELVRTSPIAAGADPSAASLSSREQLVLEWLDSDHTLPQIAEKLHVSVHTVRTQTRSIYRKLGVSRRAQAVARLRGHE